MPVTINHALKAASAISAAQKMKLMIFDVDGVLSDGSLVYTDDGQETKGFYAPDGIGLHLLQKAGIELAIITGRTTPCVERRAKDLRITHLYQGIANKVEAAEELLKKLGLSFQEVGYMGDDIIDIRMLERAAFAAAPADCQDKVRAYAHVFSTRKGGRGAAREICEFILQARGQQDELEASYQHSWRTEASAEKP